MKTLWSILLPYIPKPEVVEIEHIIGKKLIDQNEKLYEELQSLKDIVTDFLSYQFNSITITPQNSSQQQLSSSLSSSSLQQSSHDRHPSNNSRQYNLSECSSHTLEVVDLVKVLSLFSIYSTISLLSLSQDSLTLSKIHLVKDLIYQELMNEKDEFEGEIQVLQATMDTESEIISRGNTPNKSERNPIPISLLDDQSHCPYCGHNMNSLDSLGSPQSREISPRESFTSPVANRLKSKIKGGTLPLKGSNHLLLNKNTNNCRYCQPQPTNPAKVSNSISLYQEPTISRPTTASNGGISRVRSKIQAARDEKHFLEEEIFQR